jgi:hypothetical protein
MRDGGKPRHWNLRRLLLKPRAQERLNVALLLLFSVAAFVDGGSLGIVFGIVFLLWGGFSLYSLVTRSRRGSRK